ncbi:MAG TPA: TIGR03621 family F420-dependent LLM class oxidoreductase [Acidimicrobiales bacterium]|nr:TIGR03621 family F420-dependent LLM class oxidoreductase [Acidimicrobiales bacterium]
MQPFRFAVQLEGAPSGRAWRDLARQIESLGYSTLYMPDHLGDQWGPMVALTAAAEATTTLKVGALVYDNDYRHPVVLAKEMATLDLLSEGRLEVGLGAGWMRSDYDQSGIAYDEPAVRVARFEEGVQIIEALWVDGTCTFAGRHYDVEGAVGMPRPFRQPRPTLVLGGGGRRVLGVAARHADIVGVNADLRAGHVGPEVAASVTAERFDERIGWIRAAAGDRFAGLELQVLAFVAAITDDRQAMAEAIAPGFGLTAEAALEVPMVVVGTVAQVCETLQARRERYGFSYYVLHVQDIEPFAPVVARLAGT